ncbi:MAG TPA: hypothetical protein VFO10_25245 [Oligoflexus sp.]|uniref:hypothetical protein n=1 Tax=Oligoflexus sp. TaxID=1971216 RepID=UPI002D7F3A65|nr:hypothetical protein [Oligoflexus sp.]HET9240595.1 hypothetical protein [Oligoflexus sp.]
MLQDALKKLLILTAGSAACLASTSRAFALTSYVDMLTESKTCAAAWTWQEYLPAKIVNEPNMCETVEQTVLNEDGELQLTISQETEEFVIASTEKALTIESAVQATIEQNFHRSRTTYPEITNPQFLTAESRFYDKVRTPLLYPPEAIMPVYGKKTGDGECRMWKVSVNGTTCEANYIRVEIYGVYKKLKYTLPIKKDLLCPSRSSIGKSDPFVTLDQVKDLSYESIDGKSIPGAERFNIVCPHGVSYDTPSKQAQYALNWLRVRENNIDLNDQDIQGTIKYLKALALEKTSELSEFQLSSILELHKKYPALAFGGQETDDNAVETSPEDVKTNRELWAQIEKKLVAAPKPAVSLRDLRDKVEAGSVQIHSGSTSSVYVGKSMNFPEVYYNSSSFGYVTSYIFQDDGSIVASTRGGSVTHSKGSQTHTEIVTKIKESLQSYTAEDLASQNPAVKELIGMLVKYLNDEKAAPAPKSEQSFQKLAATVGSQSVNLYTGFQSMTTLSYDASQSAVTYSYQNRISARNLVFDAKGRITESWSAGGGAQTYEPGQPKHTEIANQVLTDVGNWKLNRTDLTPELIEVYDNLLAYLNTVVK